MARAISLMVVACLAGAVFTAPAIADDKGYDLGGVLNVLKGVSSSIEAATMSEQDEIGVGREVAAQTLGAYRIVHNEQLQRYLNQVGVWVAMQSGRPDLPWRFAAVEGAEVNAFAVPGGTVLITAGMLSLVANEAELACVMGHEVGHIVRKHHLDLMKKASLIQAGSSLAQLKVKDNEKGEARKYALAEGAELFTRGLDRGAERDADADGVLYAARAGYDPSACLNFMQRLASLKTEAGALEALYKTHPQASERVADVEGALARLDGAAPGTGARPALPQPKAR